MAKYRLKHVFLIRSKVLIIGLSLAVLPWLGSRYLCSRMPTRESEADVAHCSNYLSNASRPNLLPASDSVRCLLTSESELQPVLSADYPAQHSELPDTGEDGPMLTDPAEDEKSRSAYIPFMGIVPAKNYDESSADMSSTAWMPVEMPISEEREESEVANKSGQTPQNSGHSPDIEPLSSEPVQFFHNPSPPEPKTSENVANSERSAETAPAVTNAVVDQSDALGSEQEIIYPSTEPFLAKIAAANDLPVRSERLESIARQADQQTKHGYELAGRGACLAARSEFITALRLVAQGLDTDGLTKIHGKALAAGLTALKEAEDFIPNGSKIEADLDIPGIVAGHATPVLKDTDISSLTTLTAMKNYFTFAQQQLALAVGNEVAGSMALHALGKLHDELAKTKNPTIKAAGPKAMAFYQASILVFPQNFMAANDLGVMLARNGNYEDARNMLELSLSINRQSSVWHNLAVVYQRMGRIDIARQAQQQSLIAMQIEQTNRLSKQISAGNQVRWVDETAFAQNYNPAGVQQNVVQKSTVPNNANNPVMQPASKQNWPANTNTAQTQPMVNRQMPSMRPAATGMLPNMTR